MIITKYIKELLSEKGKATIPNLGTFNTVLKSALVLPTESLVKPPHNEVEFSEDIEPSEKDMLRNFIFERESLLASQIDTEIEVFVETIKIDLEEGNEATIEGIGVLKKNLFGSVEFIQDSESNLLSDSFGLPKIEVRPLIDAEAGIEIEGGNQTKKGSQQLWLLAIPLLIIAIGVSYVFLNEAAYSSLKALMQTDNTEQVSPTQPENADNNRANTSEKPKETESNSTQDTPATSVQEKDKSTSEGEEQKPATQNTSPKRENPPVKVNTTNSGSDNIISQKTDRFFLIAASFATLNQANKGLQQAKSQGYTNAKIIQSNNRFRVTLSDHATKQEADAAVAKAKKDYKDVWRFKF